MESPEVTYGASVASTDWGICTDDDTSSCPTRDWCPFNFYRTSGDIRETWNSFVRNLLTTVRFLDAEEPLSGPHCWACALGGAITASFIHPN
jgi:hypothetical protein